MNQAPGRSRQSFQEAFCRIHRCSPDSFTRAVLRRSFPPWVRPLGSLLLLVKPALFARELDLIQRLGGKAAESGLRGELDGYVYENERDKPFRVETLGLRLSRRRFLRIYRDTMNSPSESALSAGGARTADSEDPDPMSADESSKRAA